MFFYLWPILIALKTTRRSCGKRQVDRRGSVDEAAKWSAPPGHSEHHTGYALDLAGQSEGLLGADEPAAAWVKNNAKHIWLGGLL